MAGLVFWAGNNSKLNKDFLLKYDESGTVNFQRSSLSYEGRVGNSLRQAGGVISAKLATFQGSTLHRFFVTKP